MNQVTPLKLTSKPKQPCILVDSDKGGVGKSRYAGVITEWLLEQNLERKIIGVDCDRSNQSFADYYEKVIPMEYAYFTEDKTQAWNADHLLELAIKYLAILIADLPAQTYRSQLAYFNQGGLRAAQRCQVQFIKFYLCADIYSAEQFVDSVKAFGSNIPHVLVLNEGLCLDFSFLDDSQEFQTLLEEFAFPILRMPEIPYREREIINTFRLPYAQAIESEHLTITGQQRLIDFLMDCYEQLDQLELF